MTWLKQILYTSITLLNKYTTPLSKHLAKDIRQLSKNINMFIPLLVPKENAAVGFAPNILFLVVKFLIGTNLKQKKCSITLTMFNCHIYYSVRLKKCIPHHLNIGTVILHTCINITCIACI